MPFPSLLQVSGASSRRCLGAIVLACSVLGVPSAAHAHDAVPELADLVDRLTPSVVNITARALVPQNTNSMNAAGTPPATANIPSEQRAKTLLGSGFVIDPDGIIVTNNHVIEGAFDISVTFRDGTVAHANVIGTTKIGDIALLKVNLHRPLPAVKWGDSTHLRPGDSVIAIGNPLGFGGSVSTGIVSALNRDISISPFDDFIQTDASLNHGNSGGPLYNANGEVIGVNTALYTPTNDGGSIGIGFAIPSYCAQFVVDQLLKYGYVRAGELGLTVQDVTTEIARASNLPEIARATDVAPGSAGWGVIVTNVTPDGPASAVGLKEADILLQIDGKPISDVRQLAREVAVRPLDRPVKLLLWRNGALETVRPVVREWLSGQKVDRAALALSNAPREMSMDMGLKLAALTADVRSERNIPPEQSGVLVTKVMPDSIAGDRGLAEGDVIEKVMTTPVSSPQDLLNSLKQTFKDNRLMVLLLVRGASGTTRWVPLPIDPGLAEFVKKQG